MEVGEAQAICGQAVNVRRLDLAAECAYVGEAKIISDDDEEVGLFRHRGGRIIEAPLAHKEYCSSWRGREGVS